MRKTDITPQLLSEADAAKYLSICPRTLWGLRASGEIAFLRVGRSIRYDLADLQAFIERIKAETRGAR